ncbi:MAG: hypothetical protein U0L58_10455 [Ruminococcus sp.]|nr:hypothetical protein [Ruminococcus sp.]
MPTATTGKLKRSAHLFYIDTTFGGSTPSWYLVGKDVEDMSIELNPDVESKKNILDETTVNDNGYEPSISVDTYYANPSDGEFYTKIKNIAMNRLTGDACRTKILEVLVDKAEGAFDAWQEDAVIKPQSYGGPQGGISIPYNVHFDGNRVQGTATITDKVPSFTKST